MKITNEAKPQIEQVLNDKNAQGLMMEVHESCCGKSPVFALVVFDENDNPELVNGIKVLIPEQYRDLAEKITIDLIDGELFVTGVEEHECCGHHDHEGCCGHHDHDEGHCCHHNE